MVVVIFEINLYLIISPVVTRLSTAQEFSCMESLKRRPSLCSQDCSDRPTKKHKMDATIELENTGALHEILVYTGNSLN